MSYISNLDATVMHAPVEAPLPAAPVRASSPRLRGMLPVGPALEAVLLVGTSSAVSLVMCTAVAGALLQ